MKDVTFILHREDEDAITNEELKPCPFCNSNEVIVTWNSFYKNHFYVECEDCGAKTDEYYCEEKAIEAWNRRECDDT